MNKIALGTVQLGMPYGIANQSGQVSRPVAASMLELARRRGINTLDTAIAYGESEVCLGELGVREFSLVTKLPAIPAETGDIRKWVHDQISGSFGRLGVDSVYGLLLHRPDQLLSRAGDVLFDTLQELKALGRVKKIGVSIYAPSELDVLMSKYRFDLIQAPFNLVDRRLLLSGWLQRLKQEDVEVHIRSAFLQGLLLMEKEAIPQKFSPWSPIWECWHHWLAHNRVSALRACLAYPLQFPEIDRIVVGADSLEQLTQIIDGVPEDGVGDLPDLSSDDENLINPARWSQL